MISPRGFTSQGEGRQFGITVAAQGTVIDGDGIFSLRDVEGEWHDCALPQISLFNPFHVHFDGMFGGPFPSAPKGNPEGTMQFLELCHSPTVLRHPGLL